MDHLRHDSNESINLTWKFIELKRQKVTFEMNLKNLVGDEHRESKIEGVEEEYLKLHNEKSPDSWKELFYFEMFKTGKIHVVPAAAVCISVDCKKGEVFTCPIGEFKYTGSSSDLITEIMQGRRIFPVTSMEVSLY